MDGTDDTSVTATRNRYRWGSLRRELEETMSAVLEHLYMQGDGDPVPSANTS